VTSGRVERRLAAVLAADVAGYSRLMGADEVGTLAALKTLRRDIVDPTITSHKGRIVKTTGDGMLVEFASAVDAVTCAVSVQQRMAKRNAGVDSKIAFRIGINIGDIIIEGDDIFGDGVNVAARVENECEPGSVCLSGSAYDQVRGKTPFTFDDHGERSLKNIDRPVRLYAARSASTSPTSQHTAEATPPTLPNKPSIAVLPFQNMSGDPEQEYFADGMVEEITTALSRSRWLFVIARNSAFTYKGKAIDISRVGRELGVRYVLEGSVRRSGSRVRITGQLIEVATQAHIWADRFDGNLDDIFDLQDRVAESVIGAVVPTIEKAEIALAVRRPTENLTAYEHYLRGMGQFYQFTKEGHQASLPFFVKAAEADPHFALAYAGQAGWYISGKAFAFIDIDTNKAQRAEHVAREALRLDSDDSKVLAYAGQALTYVVRQVEEGSSLLSRAVELDPNLAIARLWLGGAKMYLGRFDEAVGQFQLALRLSPVDPRAFLAYSGVASSHFLSGRYQEALEWAADGIRRWPLFVQLHRQRMAALAMLGRLEEAARSREEVLRLDAALTISEMKRSSPYRPEDLERMVAAWRLGGMPE
jgi:TolB-like protein/Tfp pilus assembly protein PilF